jgi:hypothetical protein
MYTSYDAAVVPSWTYASRKYRSDQGELSQEGQALALRTRLTNSRCVDGVTIYGYEYKGQGFYTELRWPRASRTKGNKSARTTYDPKAYNSG